MTPLAGKGAVITGGGRGIGAAVARALLAEGASVVVSARTSSEIVEVAEELRRGGGQAWAVTCDVADEASVMALGEVAREHLGTVDILANNAGVASSAPVAKLRLEEWNRIFAVNATGTFLCTRAFLPEMTEREWGRVINVASVSGLMGARYISAYTASKHAVVGFTRSIAAEVARSGVTVNAVCPGYVDTSMTDDTVDNITAKTRLSSDEARESITTMNGHGRLVTPDEVADAVRWLAGDGAASVNGQSIVMDGGGLLA